MKSISVIIPCYNVSSFIDRCLTSVTSQTIGISSLEIICVDDASTDDTFSRLKQWEQKYPDNILLIQCEQNGRQGRARNIGLTYASAPYIGFIDSDDWIEPDYFEKLYQAILQYGCDVTACLDERDFSMDLSSFENRFTGKQNQYLCVDTVEKRKYFFFSHGLNYAVWGKLFRKSFLTDNQLFFPENLAYEDCYFGPLLLLCVSSAYIIEEKLYHYFVNRSSTLLQKNSDHHLDHLTVNLMLWEECNRRNFLPAYRDELEFDFLFTCYLAFLKIMVLRYETPSYSQFLLLKQCVSERIPNYRTNKYIRQGNCVTEVQSVILESLLSPMSKAEFMQFIDNIKILGFI